MINHLCNCADKPLVSAYRCRIIIIIIIIGLFLLISYYYHYHHHHHHHQFWSHRCLAGFQGIRVTDQALLIHYSGKSFQTIQHVLSITALCVRVYWAVIIIIIIIIIIIVIIIIIAIIGETEYFNLLKTKHNLIYIRNQSVPRSKHFQPRL